MKKTVVLIFCLCACSYVFGDCYSNWTSSYNKATSDYINNLKSCEKALSTVRCNREADLAYNHSVNIAGDAYYDCINYQ